MVGSDGRVVQHGFFRTFGRHRHAVHNILFGILNKVVCQPDQGLFAGFTHDYGEIFLFQFSVSQTFRKAGSGFRSFRKDHYSARGSVESVDESDESVAGFVILCDKVFFHYGKHILVARSVGAGRYVYRFDHHYNMVIFEYYVKVFISKLFHNDYILVISSVFVK